MTFASAAPASNFATGALPGQPADPFMNPRLMSVVAAVVCAHGLALWALQAGFLRPKARTEMPPVVMLATLLETPQPQAAPSPAPEPAPPAQPPRAEQPPPKLAAPKPSPAPVPAIDTQAPAPIETAISVSAAAENPAPVAIAPAQATLAPATTAAISQATTPSPPAPPASPSPPKVELPSSNASYLNNPKAPYPPLSKRLGEQGKVVVRVLIGTDGNAGQASVQTSSGYDRLDRTALETVSKWRFVPGKRGGVPEAMWFNVPLSFVLE